MCDITINGADSAAGDTSALVTSDATLPPDDDAPNNPPPEKINIKELKKQKSTSKFHSNQRHNKRDSISVQLKHDYVNDDEYHESHPHLQDFLVPHHSVHVDEPGAEKDAENAEQTAEQHKGQQKGQAEKEQEKRPSLPKPCPSIMHRTDCDSRKECAKTESKRAHVSFGNVIVRDYPMILGDHPSCRWGAPVGIGWDYTEYEPLPVNEYELHHALRRPLRQMYLKEFRRKHYFLQVAGYSIKEVNVAARDVKRIQNRRRRTSKVPVAIGVAWEKMRKLVKKKGKQLQWQGEEVKCEQ